ncbi:carboxymuconolactone decarboxylase family protein [Actinoplanes sp. KI2]|uniref:carboxymuconolactone decarboxylase family protein n=1 Tax=Actinoplanes sp. KI2 TaxID=2983315 RepID=UPI0021D614C4|nr:carboxymuconolactone decarboxylase family protein [Actinoplanes sp. KI2]MCU7724345.1 carboxymuconolactone decarboxylase family protein [Actinoplanes sp. KI2]
MSNTRVPPLPPQERDDRQAALIVQAGAELGIYATLVRSPDVFADLLPFGQRLLQLLPADPRARELLIMRVAWRCRAPYIWTHHEVIGRAAGLTDDDLAVLAADRAGEARAGGDCAGEDRAGEDRAGDDCAGEDRDPFRALLLRAADELVTDHRLSDPTWAAMSERYPAAQLIEICLLVGQYSMLAGTLNSLGVQLEEGYQPPTWAE